MLPIRQILSILILLSFTHAGFSQTLNADLSEACYGDIDITEYVAMLIKNGSAETEMISKEEGLQIKEILEKEENLELSTSDKLAEVLHACAEGRIFQERFSYIINAQP